MPETRPGQPFVVGVVLFEGNEPLDWIGPVSLLARVEGVQVLYISSDGPAAPPVASQPVVRLAAVADHSFASAPRCDLLVVPGGIGTRREVRNSALLSFLRSACEEAATVLSVCTGSPLLAAAGCLDGRRATSNKLAFEDFVVKQGGGRVDWVREARWVRDGKYVTSSGVTAGMDAAVQVITDLWGEQVALKACWAIEYEPHRNSSWDPFARAFGS